MDVTPLVGKGQQIIQSYQGGAFRVSGTRYEEPLLVFPDRTEIWNLNTIQANKLKASDFDVLVPLKDQLDVILLGTGQEIYFLDKEVKAQIRSAGLHVDIMDTGAACRTYNVLMAEGRRVVAALLPS